jgi:DNA-binding transcriptional ArsR family regulator
MSSRGSPWPGARTPSPGCLGRSTVFFLVDPAHAVAPVQRRVLPLLREPYGQIILSVMTDERGVSDEGADLGVSSGVAIISEPERASVLLKDPRRRILQMALEPVSAVEMAERLGESRQRVGYHVRRLVEAGLLEDVEVARRGAMIDKRYRASAASYALAPSLLGSLAARVDSSADRESVAHLLGALNEVQDDVARVLAGRESTSDRLPTLTLSTRLRFRAAAERGAFADALVKALTDVVARYSAPHEREDGSAPDGDPFRLTLTLNPTEP